MLRWDLGERIPHLRTPSRLTGWNSNYIGVFYPFEEEYVAVVTETLVRHGDVFLADARRPFRFTVRLNTN